MARWLFFLIIFTPLSAWTEYRVFQLRIEKRDAQGAVIATREVQSVLDPRQYRAYHPVVADETVTYTKTWRCPGRTGDFRPFCPPPAEPGAATTEADQSPVPDPAAEAPPRD